MVRGKGKENNNRCPQRITHFFDGQFFYNESVNY